MANNSIPNGTKVTTSHLNMKPISGIVVSQSRLSDEHVIIEWDDDFVVSVEHVDDLIEIK